MVLQNIHTETKDEQYKVIVEIKSQKFGKNIIWFAVSDEFKDFLIVDRYDAFLVAMLYPAMISGEDIIIKGMLSYKLYSNIMTYVQAILLSFSPELKKINIIADNFYDEMSNTSQTITPDLCKNGIGTGFSGGVDSFCTIYDHYVLEKNERKRINALVFLNVGSHGKYTANRTRDKFIERYNYLQDYPKSINVPFINVDSNIHKFHEEYGHTRTVTLTNASGILALQNYFSKYYISSAISYEEMMLFGKHSKNIDMAEYSEPYLLPLLSTETLEFIPDGQQYSRTEKIIHISSYTPVHKYLNVCVASQSDARNCSQCPKCCRTLMTLESGDKLQDFSEIFDIKKYKHWSFQYKCLQRFKYNKDPFAKDNVDFARKNGKYIPPYYYAVIICFPYILRIFFKAILQKIMNRKQYNNIKVLMEKKKHNG